MTAPAPAALAVLLTAVLLAAGCGNADGPVLTEGRPAPPLEGVEWIAGEPVEPGDGPVVVEFWATWCAPCRTSIPHLTELQRRYAGRLRIAGLSWEERDAITPFVAEMGEEMDYAVGRIPRELAATWMDGVTGIPHAFLLDADGRIVWQGHPMALDRPLVELLGG